jgi:hypothetical protein
MHCRPCRDIGSTVQPITSRNRHMNNRGQPDLPSKNYDPHPAHGSRPNRKHHNHASQSRMAGPPRAPGTSLARSSFGYRLSAIAGARSGRQRRAGRCEIPACVAHRLVALTVAPQMQRNPGARSTSARVARTSCPVWAMIAWRTWAKLAVAGAFSRGSGARTPGRCTSAWGEQLGGVVWVGWLVPAARSPESPTE